MSLDLEILDILVFCEFPPFTFRNFAGLTRAGLRRRFTMDELDDVVRSRLPPFPEYAYLVRRFISNLVFVHEERHYSPPPNPRFMQDQVEQEAGTRNESIQTSPPPVDSGGAGNIGNLDGAIDTGDNHHVSDVVAQDSNFEPETMEQENNNVSQDLRVQQGMEEHEDEEGDNNVQQETMDEEANSTEIQQEVENNVAFGNSTDSPPANEREGEFVQDIGEEGGRTGSGSSGGSEAEADGSGSLEIPPEFRLPAWLLETFPKRSPYFPQLGDDLVYLRQGHEAYIKYVDEKKLYAIPKKMKKSLPYIVKPEMESQVSVRVVGINFEILPPRVAIVKLARTDWNTGELLQNENLYVKFHDVEMVDDFLILRHIYEDAIKRKWNEGDRFRCLIGRNWFLGSVIKFGPYSEDYPKSNYLCYEAKYVNGDDEDPHDASPWDMQTIPDDFVIPDDFKDGIASTEDDLRLGLYQPIASDWPPHGHQDAQCQKLSNLLKQVMALAVSEPFLKPVDLKLYPGYAYNIGYPMDLSTIKARLDNKFYRRMDALKFDIAFIALNVEKFNESVSEIVRRARDVRDVCLELLGNPDITCVRPIYDKIRKKNESSTSTSLEETKRQSIRKSLSNSSSNSKGEKSSSHSRRHGSASTSTSTKMPLAARREDADEDDNQEWSGHCLDLLNELYNTKDAAPFREAVNAVNYREYYQQIYTPVDLGTIREDLLGNKYANVQAFHKDMMLVFSNSKQFNREQPTIYSMTCRLQSSYECKILSILQRTASARGSSSTPAKRGGQASPKETGGAHLPPRKNPRRSTVAGAEADEPDQEQKNLSRENRMRGAKKVPKKVNKKLC